MIDKTEPSWADRMLRALDVMRFPQEYLTPPAEKDAPDLDAMLELRGLVFPLPSVADQLDMIRNGGMRTWAGMETDPTRGAIRFFASRCGSAEGAAVAQGYIHEFLEALEAAVARQAAAVGPAEALAAGVVLACEFGDTELILDGERKVIVGVLATLPAAGHPYHGIAREPVGALAPPGGGPRRKGLALGPPLSSGKPRLWYDARQVLALTEEMSRNEENKIASRPAGSLSEEELARLRRREQGDQGSPALPLKVPARPLTRRPPLPEAWADRVRSALDALPAAAGQLWHGPPGPDVPLAALLEVRGAFIAADAFSNEENESAHLRSAATRAAYRWVGATRREEIEDLLTAVIRGLDRVASNAMEAGTRWAARRGTAVDTELSELRRRLEALEKKGARR
jgi:hypothetical protein